MNTNHSYMPFEVYDIYFNNTPEGTARLAQSVLDYSSWMTWGSRDPYFP